MTFDEILSEVHKYNYDFRHEGHWDKPLDWEPEPHEYLDDQETIAMELIRMIEVGLVGAVE